MTAAAGAAFDFTSEVSGFQSLVQNVLVEIGQKLGSDIIFDQKGNELHENAVSGGFVNPEVLGEALRGLSNDITTFINDTDESYNADRLTTLEIDLEVWDGDQARLNVIATSSTGEIIGESTAV